MANNGLFVMNSALDRIGYIKNVVILAFIAFITNFIFINFAIPFALTDDYVIILSNLRIIILFAFLLVFISLMDRRIYGISGSRNTAGYKTALNFSWFVFIIQIFNYYCQTEQSHLKQFNANLGHLASVLGIILLVMAIVIAFIKSSKINNDL